MTQRQINDGTFRKSSYSGGGNDCVEVGAGADHVGIRDTKDRARGHFAVPVGSWAAFVDKVGA